MITIYNHIGTVHSYSDGRAVIKGAQTAFYGELRVGIDNSGVVCSLEKKKLILAFFKKSNSIKPGYLVGRTRKALKVKVGPKTLGSTLNGIASEFLSLSKKISQKNIKSRDNRIPRRDAEARAPGIIPRSSVTEPLYTGLRVVDSLIPLGRGQRELIIGDRKIGKTTIGLDARANQKRNNEYFSIEGFGTKRLYCIYAAIGQKKRSLRSIEKNLIKSDSYWYSSLISAFADDLAPRKYRAPYSGTSRGEYYRDNGSHSLIVYDDLTKHADAYRQRSLLLEASPGREAFPGDIFYTHSRLLERSAKRSKRYGYGSLTALPIVETQAGDVSAYIATNVISITDGQIFLDTELFNRGLKPAVNVGLSVSRVGSKAQTALMKLAAGQLKGIIAQYREMELFAKFGSDLDSTIKRALRHGKLSSRTRIQEHSKPRSVEKQTIIRLLVSSNKLDSFVIGEKRHLFIKKLIYILSTKRISFTHETFFNLQDIRKLQRHYLTRFNQQWTLWQLNKNPLIRCGA